MWAFQKYLWVPCSKYYFLASHVQHFVADRIYYCSSKIRSRTICLLAVFTYSTPDDIISNKIDFTPLIFSLWRKWKWIFLVNLTTKILFKIFVCVMISWMFFILLVSYKFVELLLSLPCQCRSLKLPSEGHASFTLRTKTKTRQCPNARLISCLKNYPELYWSWS